MDPDEIIIIAVPEWLDGLYHREYPQPPDDGTSIDVLNEYVHRQRVLIALQDAVIELQKVGVTVEVMQHNVDDEIAEEE